MRHRAAVELLEESRSGSLDPAADEELNAHVARCGGCRSWLATYDLLRDGFVVASLDAAGAHPASELLVLCAVRPEEIDEPGREDLRRHLTLCASCRSDVELTAHAVRSARARPSGSGHNRRSGWNKMVRAPSRVAVAAAGLLACLGVAGGWLVGRGTGAPTVRPPQVSRASAPPTGVGLVQRVSDQQLDGAHTITAPHSLAVSGLIVERGADVTFRAGERVAFGDGFQVSAGGRIRVYTDP